MSKRMDGVRTPTKRIVTYPDLADLLEPAPIESALVVPHQPVATRPAALAPRRQQRPKLKVVRRGLLRSGFSWFLVFAVLSSSLIGFFSVVEGGRAAKNEIGSSAAQAESALAAAATALGSQQPDLALAEFDKAVGSFQEVQQQVGDLSNSVRAVVALVPGDPLVAADQLAQAGIHLATAGRALTGVVQILSGIELETVIPGELLEQSGTQADESAEPAQHLSLTDALVAAQPDIHAMITELTEAGRLIVALDTRGLPQDIAGPLEQIRESIPGLLYELNSLGGLVTVLAELGGASQARTYAVVFQNPNELRPTGGFWGQIAFVKMQNGLVEKLDIKSIYDPAGQVRSQQTAPEGLDVISQEFSLQDANWYPDFASSARVLMGFLSETGDPRLDGVIALNPQVITDLLALTGPVAINDLNLTVTEDTFVEEAQYEVPEKDLERNQAFFPGFAEQFLERLFALDREEGVRVVQIMMDAITHKDLQLFFEDELLAALPDTLNAGGNLPLDVDLVAPVFANIGGGKTDQFVQETRSLSLALQGDTIRHELSITRRDTRTDQFKDRDNRSYLRVYVPPGARLVSASGFDTDIKALAAHSCEECQPAFATPIEQHIDWEPISNTKTYLESGHRVFANWVTLKYGEERTIKLIYDIPRGELVRDGTLKLFAWRQPGSGDVPIDIRVEQSNIVAHVTGAQQLQGQWAQRLVLDRDHVVGILLHE